jgi:lipoprotein NlpI
MKSWWFLWMAALLATPAMGQNGWNDDAQKCNDLSGDPAIEACTRAIASGQLSQPNLAVTYMNRGVEWRHKGDDERAMADYNQAIVLDPNNALAYNDRGNVWADRADFTRAIADYDKAVQLDPSYLKAYNNRGVARFVEGDWAAAGTDFAHSHALGPKDDYAVLWQAMAGMRQKNSGWAQQLDEEAKELSPEWPMPLVRLYQGQITADQLLAQAGDTSAQPERLCDVGFYLGEWKLVHGQSQEAAAYLKQALSACPHTYSEYEIAAAELKLLGGK